MLNDAAGKPICVWDSRNNILQTTYDKLHRPVNLELKNDAHPGWIVVGFTCYGEDIADDKLHNLRGKAFRSYDQSGLVKNERFDFKGNTLEVKRRLVNAFDVDTDWQPVIDPQSDQEPDTLLMSETFTQLNEYDALNRITKQYGWHKGTGSRVSVYQPKYNKRGLLASEDVLINAIKSTTGTDNGKPTPVIKKLTYNEKGQRLSITYGIDVTTTYEYDFETFRLIHLKTIRQSDNKTLQDLCYTYDPSGNITQINDNAQPTIFFNNFQVDAQNLYTYDALYRLIKAEGREHAGQVQFNTCDNWDDRYFRNKYQIGDNMAWRNYTERYEYDSVGNILSLRHRAHDDTASSWTRQYQYSTTNNRLLATGIGAAFVEHYTDTPTLEYLHNYNAHGSMMNMPHLAMMDWDFTEHLSHIARAAGTQSSEPDESPDTSLEAWYRYDAAKERTRKRVVKQGGIVEERIYLGGFEIYREYNKNSTNPTLERETLHIMDDEQRIALVETKTNDNQFLIRYQLSNHLGSASLELDNNAQIISYEEYHPYGTTAYQAVDKNTMAAAKRYKYTGKERDEESGLHYHGARYYMAWLGRWMSCDPAGLMDGINSYTYVNNVPIQMHDPTGTQQKIPDLTENKQKAPAPPGTQPKAPDIKLIQKKQICFNENDKQMEDKDAFWDAVFALIGREAALKVKTNNPTSFNDEHLRKIKEGNESLYLEICGSNIIVTPVVAGTTERNVPNVEQWVKDLKGKYAKTIERATSEHESLHVKQNEYLSKFTLQEQGSLLDPKKFSIEELKNWGVPKELQVQIKGCKEYQTYSLMFIIESQVLPERMKKSLEIIKLYIESRMDPEKMKACERLLPFKFEVTKDKVIIKIPEKK